MAQFFTKGTIQYQEVFCYLTDMNAMAHLEIEITHLTWRLGYELSSLTDRTKTIQLEHTKNIDRLSNVKNKYDVGDIVSRWWEVCGVFIKIGIISIILLPLGVVAFGIALLASAIIPLILCPINSHYKKKQKKEQLEKEERDYREQLAKTENAIRILKSNYEYAKEIEKILHFDEFFDDSFGLFHNKISVIESAYHRMLNLHKNQLQDYADLNEVSREYVKLVLIINREIPSDSKKCYEYGQQRADRVAVSLVKYSLKENGIPAKPHSEIMNYCESIKEQYESILGRWNEMRAKGEI